VLLTLHVDKIMKLQQDRKFYQLLPKFDIITCDSQILTITARLLGTPLKERVSGSDYFPRFCMRYRDDLSVTVFICGGAPGVAESAHRKINAKMGRQMVVGTKCHRVTMTADPEEIDQLIAQINRSGATVLLVGLGGGRQEKFQSLGVGDAGVAVVAAIRTTEPEAPGAPLPRAWAADLCALAPRSSGASCTVGALFRRMSRC